ncbi:MAG: polysaccharide biosynthesis C-terminal domain-containing protein, partial [Actinomycetota bacterium]|nr:polysaccharide biosynthesis C-terminal domain-containing protein [Actinomycetota bacterium]
AAGFAALRSAAGTLLAAAGTAVLLALLDDRSAAWAGLAVMATLPLAGVSSLVVLAHARLRPDITAGLSLGQSVLWLATAVLVAGFEGGLGWYGAAFLACAIAQSGVTWLIVARPEPPAWARWRAAGRWIVRRSWPLAVAGALVTVYYRLDGVLVFRWAGPAEAGFYAAAYRFLDVIQLVPAALAGVVLPVLARSWAVGDRDRMDRVLRLAVTLAVTAAIPVSVGSLLVGDRLAVAVFGAPFAEAGEVLSVLGLAFLSIAVGYLYSSVLVATGRVGVVAVVSGVAAVGSVAADAMVIPRWGAVGAAWVTVGVEYLVSSSLALWLHFKYRLRFLPWDRLRRVTLAAAVMAAVTWALRDGPVVFVVAAAATTYMVTAAALGVVTRDEIRGLTDRRLPLGAPAPVETEPG